MRSEHRIGFRHAARGVAIAWRDQRNLRIEAAIGAAALAVGVWLGVPLAPIVLACGLVLSAELANTAIEAVVDLASPHADPLAARAKDVAAGAVLVAAGASVLVGIVHLGPPLLERIARGSP